MDQHCDCLRKLLVMAALFWSSLASAAPAGPETERPARPEKSYLNPFFYGDMVRRSLADVHAPEIAEVLVAIAQGSQMGPGEGWFHPGQSRFGWDWLAARSKGGCGQSITRESFPGPAEVFDRLDRNRDGVLTPDDFDWSDCSPFMRQAGLAAQWFRLIDADSNGRISRQEWDAFYTRAVQGKAYLTPEDLRQALNPVAPKPQPGQPPPGMPSLLILVKGLFTGELGSIHEGPKVGQPAPDFDLPTQDGRQRIRLSQFRGKKPVVLIFGSFT